MGRYINRTAKRHIIAWKDFIWRIDQQNWSTSATCARAHETKKDKGRNFSVANSLFAQTTTSSNRNTVWRGGWSSGISYKFQVSSTSAEWLPSYEGSKNKKKWSPLLRPVAYTTAYSHTAVISMISVCLLQPVGYEVSILMTLCGISLTTHGLKCVLCYSKYGGRWREISWWMVWS